MRSFSYVLRPGVDRDRFIERFVVPFEPTFAGLSPDERKVVTGPCPELAHVYQAWIHGEYELAGLAELWRN